MKVVGHRGLRNIKTENTIDAITSAISYGVDAVEIDIRLMSDNTPVLLHNKNLKKILGIDKDVSDISSKQLSQVCAKKNIHIPTIDDLINQKISIPIIFDIKQTGTYEIFHKDLIKKLSKVEWMITSNNHQEASKFKQNFKNIKVLLGSYSKPLKTLRTAKTIDAYGVTFNLISLNIFSYNKAQKLNLKVFVYQNYLPWLLTTPWIVRLLLKIYPNIIIYTDRPDKIVPIFK